MVSAAQAAPAAERVDFRRLLWAGPLAIVAAVIANVIIRFVAVAALQPDPAFMPLSVAMPIVFTIIGGLGAVIVFALLGRFARRPITLFQRIAIGVLVVSLIPDLLLLNGGMPGASVGAVATLMLMHVVAWAIIMRVLTTMARAA